MVRSLADRTFQVSLGPEGPRLVDLVPVLVVVQALQGDVHPPARRRHVEREDAVLRVVRPPDGRIPKKSLTNV